VDITSQEFERMSQAANTAPAPPQAASGQDDTSLSTGLPLGLADDPLLRVAVQELGAVVRAV
jgi:hypothetical protein